MFKYFWISETYGTVSPFQNFPDLWYRQSVRRRNSTNWSVCKRGKHYVRCQIFKTYCTSSFWNIKAKVKKQMTVTLWQYDKVPHPNLFVLPSHSTHLQMWLLRDMWRWQNGTLDMTPKNGIGGKVIKRQEGTSLFGTQAKYFSLIWSYRFPEALSDGDFATLEDSLTGVFVKAFQCPLVFWIRLIFEGQLFLPPPTSEFLLTLSQSFLWLQRVHRNRRAGEKGNKLTWSRNIFNSLSLWLRVPTAKAIDIPSIHFVFSRIQNIKFSTQPVFIMKCRTTLEKMRWSYSSISGKCKSLFWLSMPKAQFLNISS